MPRYFFNIRRGKKMIVDKEGIDLPGIAAVRRQAKQSAKEMLSEDVLKERYSGQSFIVKDERGKTVLTVDYKASIKINIPAR